MIKPETKMPSSGGSLKDAGTRGSDAPITRESLALDALIRLNQQIAAEPDLYGLVNYFLLTIAGQFSAVDSFLAMVNPSSMAEGPLYVADGAFETESHLSDADTLQKLIDLFGSDPDVLEVQSIDLASNDADVGFVFHMCGVKILMPLVVQGSVIGVLGLGDKINGKPFNESDIALLKAMLGAITPFAANLRREYFDLFNSTLQGVMIFDSECRLKRINETALVLLKQFGVRMPDPGDIYGSDLSSLFPDPPFNDWRRMFKSYAMFGGRSTIQNLIVRGNHGEKVFDVRMSFINNLMSHQKDMLLVLDDVTERKSSEAHFYDLQKKAEKGAMVSSIAHELNNYLGLVTGGIELAGRRLRKQDADGALGQLEKMEAHLATMGRFVCGLMDQPISKSRSSRSNLNELVSNLVSFARIQRRFKNVAIRTEFDEQLPAAFFDPDQITQVVLNLLNNAADAIADADRTGGKITITTGFDEEWITFSVADNGNGVPPDVKERMFKIQATTKSYGHGVGLMTCAKILNEHGATVNIDSSEGAGATITIGIPLSTSEPAEDNSIEHDTQKLILDTL